MSNKEALVQYVCAELYTQFTTRITAQIAAEPDTAKKLKRFIRAVLQFAEQYPHHYALIFLIRHSDSKVMVTREKLGQQFLAVVAQIVRDAVPTTRTSQWIDTIVRRMMEVLHGTAALWIAHPGAYGLKGRRAKEDVEAVWTLLLSDAQ